MLKNIRKIDLACTILLFLAPVIVSLGIAVSCGLHTCDDQVAATAASYFANGLGYTLPQPIIPDKITPFTPWITQGPAIILPVAFAMYVFGTSDIVPAVAAVSLWALLFGLILFILYRQPRRWLFAPVTLAIVLGVFGIFGLHFEQWTTMLGEVHAALFYVLGIAYLARSKQSIKSNVIAGMLIGLSLTSKFIMILALPGIFLASLLQLKSDEKRLLIIFRYFLALGIGIALPSLLFELCKVWTLGFTGYVDTIKAFSAMLKSQGVSGGNTLAEAAGIFEKLNILKTRFFLSPVKIILIIILSVLLAFRIRNNRVIKIFYFSAIASAVIIYMYWLFLSKGWARYAVAPIIIHLFAIGSACIELRWKENLAVIALLFLLLGGGIKYMNYELSAANNGLFSPSDARIERLKVVKFIHKELAPTKPTLVTQWWATGMDIQFYLPKGSYIYLAGDIKDATGIKYLVTNKNFQTDEQKTETGAYAKEQFVFQGKQYSIIKISGSLEGRFKKWRY